MEIRGIITNVLPIERGSGSRGPWARASIVVEYESGQYPKAMMLQCRNNKAEDFARLQVGQAGTFKFDVKCREYGGKFYNDVDCWSWQIDQPQYSGYQQGPI